LRRTGNPSATIIDAGIALSLFQGRTIDANQLRAALLNAVPFHQEFDIPLNILDASGGTYAPEVYLFADWYAERIDKGDPGIDAAACKLALTRWRAIIWLLPACRAQEARGDGDAAWRLGLIHQQREDDFYRGLKSSFRDKFAPDPDSAIAHYRKSAAAGHAGAQARLAYHAAIGRGMPRDPAEAARLARASADQENAEGLAVLGLLTLKGIGTQADPPAAAELIRRAAERGSLMAQYSLATLLFRGKGVNQDFAEGLAWLHLTRLGRNGDMPIDEYGDLMIEPWPRTIVVGNHFRLSREADLVAMARAIALRQELAKDGRWPYQSEIVF